MRPAISDSLISGQPLYLLYSYSNVLCAPARRLVRCSRRHAGDRQREVARDRQAADLQRTLPAIAQDSNPNGSVAATPACNNRLRRIEKSLTRGSHHVAVVTRAILAERIGPE